MKKVKQMFRSCQESGSFFFLLLMTNAIFVYLFWLVDAEGFYALAGIMTGLVLILFLAAVLLNCWKEMLREQTVKQFWENPNEVNELRVLSELSAAEADRFQQTVKLLHKYERLKEQQRLKQTDYEEYIEAWVHEMKRPLFLMTLLLDNRRDEMSPAVYKRMEYVHSSMQTYINQILYYARLKAAHKDYLFERVLVRECMQEAVSDLSFMLKEEGIELVWDIQEETVLTDKKTLRFMTDQLLGNAIKYKNSKRDKNTILVQVCKEKEDQQIYLRICDNGVGIRPSDLPFVMDKGFTGEPEKQKKKSTGMGLYLVKQLAEDLGISVEITSVYQEGTTVTLSFPVVEQQS